MALRGNGQLLAEVTGYPYQTLFAATPPFSLPGYTLEPLSTAPQALASFDATKPATHWVLARPQGAAPNNRQPHDLRPWDTAHAAAQAQGYAHYIEPDLLHERTPPPHWKPATAGPGHLLKDWPPFDPKIQSSLSPGWHLEPGFTDFQSVRGLTTGKGVRIGHVDTGYYPNHPTLPLNLLTSLGHDFWLGDKSAVDPGTKCFGLCQPGHGTATMALLAGRRLSLPYNNGSETFDDYMGGAPEAGIVPVRIGPTVYHLYSSALAQGLLWLLAPNAQPNYACDVATLSHGGLPSHAWASAVNMLYDAGIAIVAASGDNFDARWIDVPTRYTVYPAAFNRVIKALGATYEQQPYITDHFGEMQGNWGPEDVMYKALAAYSPNVAWASVDDPNQPYEMNGAGTSASTPQIAAACALWLSLFKDHFPKDWSRIEALRLALFASTRDHAANRDKLGWGLLHVPTLLDPRYSQRALAEYKNGRLKQLSEDTVSFPFWRLLLGLEPKGSHQDRMYELEVHQVLQHSTNPTLLKAHFNQQVPPGTSEPELRSMLKDEPISESLRNHL